MRHIFYLSIVVGIAVVIWLSIPASPAPALFQQVTDEHLQAILPLDGTATPPGITRTEWKATAEWTIETRMNWKEYKMWSANQLRDGYQTIAEDDHQITFRKTDPNEIHELRLLLDTENREIQVRFSVSPW